MSVTKSIVTSKFNVNNANLFLSSFSSENHYLFVGNHLPYTQTDSIIDQPIDSVKGSCTDIFNQMIFSKKINPTDIAYMIANYQWEPNTVYSEYSHIDKDLYSKKYYVIVDDDTEYNVYKCLNNNYGGNSTSAPSRVGSAADLSPILTGDGYIWKYMYTISKIDYEKFATNSYVPLIANSSVISAAVAGTVDNIKIIKNGAGYNNYIQTTFFKSGDISIDGVTNIFKAPDIASNIDDYYRGCVMKITSGLAINQYRKIVNYEGVGVTKKFILESGFDDLPSVGDSYEIYPYIYVWGDGSETKPAEARALINPVANSVSSIEMLSTGKNYRIGSSVIGETPNEAIPTINSILIELPAIITNSVGFEFASLQPIVSPANGHGSNPHEELNARRICISSSLDRDESGSIPIQNDFRQIGLIKNPLFTNVDLILQSGESTGSFEIGETVHQFRQLKLAGTIEVVTGNNYVYKTDQGKLSTTITILNGGLNYNSTANNQLVFNNTGTGGFGATGTFANNANGTVTSLTVISQGLNYDEVPDVFINPAASVGASNAQFLAALSNPQESTYDDAFKPNDYVLIQTPSSNFLSHVVTAPSPSRLILSSNSVLTSNSATISALVLEASGRVASISTNQLTLTDVLGKFELGKKIIGLKSGATSQISDSNGLQINDKAVRLFDTTSQLTRLVGDFSAASSIFIEDENIEQNSLLSFAKPTAYIHHVELNGGTNDDILHVSNVSGIFNLDSEGVRTIIGTVSDATLENLSNKYPGDFVKDSGSVLYYENIDPITRSDNKSEIIRIILTF